MAGKSSRFFGVLEGLLMLTSTVNGKLYVVFRYDDFSADKPGNRQSNENRQRIWEAEQALDMLFEKYGFEYVLAIVPYENSTSFDEDIEKVRFVQDGIASGRIEVAQHGFSHTNHGSIRYAKTNYSTHKRRNGEFIGREYKRQYQDIKNGKEILCASLGLKDVVTFVPPYDGWDENTAIALKQCNFKILSADMFHYYRTAEGLVLVPLTTSPFMLEDVLKEGALCENGLIVVVLHPADIVQLNGEEEAYFGIARLDSVLNKLSKRSNLEVVTFKNLSDRCDNLTVKRYQLANQLLRKNYFWRKLLPKNLWPGEKRSVFYLTAEEYARPLVFWRAASAGLVTGLIVLGFIIKWYLKTVLSSKWYFRAGMVATGLFLLSLLKEIQLIRRGYYITAISAIPGLLTVSFVAALMANAVKRVVCLDTIREHLGIRSKV